MIVRSPARHALNDLNRVVCGVLGVALGVFAVLGFTDRLDFFSTAGAPVGGLSTNGLLSTLSAVFGVVLIVAAVRGGRFASTTAAVVGALFFLSGIVNVVVLNTGLNVLAFRMPNVVFSLVVGAVLGICGVYGRMPATSGGADTAAAGSAPVPSAPADAGDVTATRELAEAERAVAAGGGTDRQRAVVSDISGLRDSGERRAAWRRTG